VEVPQFLVLPAQFNKRSDEIWVEAIALISYFYILRQKNLQN